MKNLIPFCFSLFIFNLTACQHPAPTTATTPKQDTFEVLVKTTRGDFRMEVHRAWAPQGTEHFYQLVKSGFYKDVALFRVIDGFVAQFGIHGDPATQKKWQEKIPDDPVMVSNRRGFVTFATGGPNTRTTQLFINYADNSRLDKMGFSPFALIEEQGMKIVDQFYKTAQQREKSQAREIDQEKIQKEGNVYLKKHYPKLDYILSIELAP